MWWESRNAPNGAVLILERETDGPPALWWELGGRAYLAESYHCPECGFAIECREGDVWAYCHVCGWNGPWVNVERLEVQP